MSSPKDGSPMDWQYDTPPATKRSYEDYTEQSPTERPTRTYSPTRRIYPNTFRYPSSEPSLSSSQAGDDMEMDVDTEYVYDIPTDTDHVYDLPNAQSNIQHVYMSGGLPTPTEATAQPTLVHKIGACIYNVTLWTGLCLANGVSYSQPYIRSATTAGRRCITQSVCDTYRVAAQVVNGVKRRAVETRVPRPAPTPQEERREILRASHRPLRSPRQRPSTGQPYNMTTHTTESSPRTPTHTTGANPGTSTPVSPEFGLEDDFKEMMEEHYPKVQAFERRLILKWGLKRARFIMWKWVFGYELTSEEMDLRLPHEMPQEMPQETEQVESSPLSSAPSSIEKYRPASLDECQFTPSSSPLSSAPSSSPLSSAPSSIEKYRPASLDKCKFKTPKSVAFHLSPTTGAPVTQVKRFVIGEAMDYIEISSASNGFSQGSIARTEAESSDSPIEHHIAHMERRRDTAALQPIHNDAFSVAKTEAKVNDSPIEHHITHMERRRDPVTLQTTDNNATLQATHNDTALQPTHNDAALQPIHNDTTAQYIHNDTILQSTQNDSALQSTQNDTTLQPTHNDTTLQPIHNDAFSDLRGRPSDNSKKIVVDTPLEMKAWRNKDATAQPTTASTTPMHFSISNRKNKARDTVRKRNAEEARLAKARKEAEKKAKEEEARKKRDERRMPSEKVIKPLTAEWERRVDAAMAAGEGTQLASTSAGSALSRRDLGTVLPVPGRDRAGGWLNDEVVTGYLQAVVDHGQSATASAGRGKTPKFYAFNTFFYSSIRDKGVESVRRWAGRGKIGGRTLLEVERVFVPVHENWHWTMVVVSPMARAIEYFDSLGGAGTRHVGHVKAWLAQELGPEWVEEEWTVVDSPSPRQANGLDCGVFAVTTAKMITLGINPLAYGPEDIPVQRRRMVAELLNGGFTGDFEP